MKRGERSALENSPSFPRTGKEKGREKPIEETIEVVVPYAGIKGKSVVAGL